MNVAGQLKSERERLRLSQTQLAERLGVGKTTVINWEKGQSAPDAAQLSAMSAAGADVLFIVTGRRSQRLPPEATLPDAELKLLNGFRLCTPEAQKSLIQMAAMLAAGMPGAAAPPASSGGIHQHSTGNNSMQVGTMNLPTRGRGPKK